MLDLPLLLKAAAFIVAGFSAMFRFQYQGLFYLLVVIFGVYDVIDFTFITFLHIFVLMLSAFKRGVGDK